MSRINVLQQQRIWSLLGKIAYICWQDCLTGSTGDVFRLTTQTLWHERLFFHVHLPCGPGEFFWYVSFKGQSHGHGHGIEKDSSKRVWLHFVNKYWCIFHYLFSMGPLLWKVVIMISQRSRSAFIFLLNMIISLSWLPLQVWIFIVPCIFTNPTSWNVYNMSIKGQGCFWGYLETWLYHLFIVS